MTTITTTEIEIAVDEGVVRGDLSMPPDHESVVVFAHGSGSSRLSERNRAVAAMLNRSGHATLLMDLLTAEEERRDDRTGEFRFDIDRMVPRVAQAVGWLDARAELGGLPLGLFGASTGAAAALGAAAELGGRVGAVVSRGGRPDLAGPALEAVESPTLLIVGGADTPVIEFNEQAARSLAAPTEIVLIDGATHLFAEPGALEKVAGLAAAWFGTHLFPDPGDVG